MLGAKNWNNYCIRFTVSERFMFLSLFFRNSRWSAKSPASHQDIFLWSEYLFVFEGHTVAIMDKDVS